MLLGGHNQRQKKMIHVSLYNKIMLEKITIKNFKSIVAIELDLGRVNVFIGENGCGKTNILEAIAVGSAATANKLDKEFLRSRGIRANTPKMMKSLFETENKSDKIEITMKNSHSIRNKVIIQNHSEKPNNFVSTYKIDIDENDEEHYIAEEDTSFYSPEIEMSNFLIYAPENYFLRRFEEEGQITPLGVHGEGLFQHLVEIYRRNPELLAKISEKLKLIDWFQGFEIPTDLLFTERRINIKDRFLENLSNLDSLNYFDQRSANEGFLYLLFYFTLLMSNETPSFFAVDNIDNGLNPKLCAELIRNISNLSKEHKKQVILTTHNPAILDGLDLYDNEQRLFTIYRNGDGHTKVRRIIPKPVVKGIETVRNSEAYIRGYLGGLPKNF